MIPDNVEKIIMTKEDYDRNVEQLLVEKLELEQELQRKDNVINGLKKWCNECLEDHRIAREEGSTIISDIFFEMVLDKIKELEKSGSDE